MPLVTVEDQGFFTPGQIISAVAERMIAQKQRQEALDREKQAFALQQRVLGAQATTAEARAGNVGTEISQGNERGGLDIANLRQTIDQGGQLFPSRLRTANTGADTAQAQLGRLNAMTPLDVRQATAQAATAEADAALRPQLDPLKVRGATADTTVREADANLRPQLDPLAVRGAKARTIAAENDIIPTDEDAEITTDALGNITEKVTRTKGGMPFGSAVKVMKGNRPLGSTGGATKIEYVKDPITGEVLQTLVTRVSPSGEMVQNVIPPAGGALDPTAPQPGAKAGAKAPTKPAGKAAAPAAAKKTTFADLPVGAEFTQNGVKYKKTGDKTAEPVK